MKKKILIVQVILATFLAMFTPGAFAQHVRATVVVPGPPVPHATVVVRSGGYYGRPHPRYYHRPHRYYARPAYYHAHYRPRYHGYHDRGYHRGWSHRGGGYGHGHGYGRRR